MKIIQNIKEMQQEIRYSKSLGKSIGFVPTMGALHEGHLSLVKEAQRENDIIVMSVFVNPLQFGPNEDFECYPRNVEKDAALAEDAGVHYLFYPDASEMYPKPLSVKMLVKERVNVLCGAKREGHFDGVVTVLTKLFHIIQPEKVYFGLKDAQQIAVIEGLVEDYFFPIEVVRVPTVREIDGLAKSSRNVYLSETERAEAPALYESLKRAKEKIENGRDDPEEVKNSIKDFLSLHITGAIDYIEIYSYPKLERVEKLQGEIIIALAVQFKEARLIDNIIINV
ncbi:pantoate--beta-alanine ligase [Bacillus seohaeanensis]|uniref:Pantothenate synthetase n=1 Tax=Bacillus seohaeanensis TaxID=284580 RepID=A0ABW5RLD4_9BACI